MTELLTILTQKMARLYGEFGKILRREDGSAVAHSVANFRLARDPTEASPTLDTVIPGASSLKFARRLSLDAGGNRHAITISVYDRGMPVSVNLQTVHPRKLAAVRREVTLGAVGSAWGPAPGQGLGVHTQPARSVD